MAVHFRKKSTGTIVKFREPHEKPKHMARARKQKIEEVTHSSNWEKVDIDKLRAATKAESAPEKK